MPANSIHAFNTATWSLDNSFLVQLTDPGEAYDAVCPFYVIDHPEGVVVVDTGISHEMLDAPGEYGTDAGFMEAFRPAIEYDESMHPQAHLDSAGYSPGDVDYVVMSHLHSDHAGHMDIFPDATFIVQQAELRYCWWPAPVQEVFYLDGDFGVLRSPQYDVTVVKDEYDVFGDGSVVTVPTPGHTPGHQSVEVELASGTAVLGIDIAHQESALEREHTASFNSNLDRALESMRSLKARARAKNAEIYVTHDNKQIEAFENGMR
jgi:glyoxylase-like metal-dependent hydrolase (beta-lactamase superfamily II)